MKPSFAEASADKKERADMPPSPIEITRLLGHPCGQRQKLFFTDYTKINGEKAFIYFIRLLISRL